MKEDEDESKKETKKKRIRKVKENDNLRLQQIYGKAFCSIQSYKKRSLFRINAKPQIPDEVLWGIVLEHCSPFPKR